MIDKITNFIIEYTTKFIIVEQYLSIINKTKMLYNRKFTHNVYLNLANETLKELEC